ncbi:hypothetical protein JOF56_006446 [Kibdelosporangium banguiense]|uniref:Nuclear transport factor 2 family protein n=1 Tax=Kibdelosporangium banguiense TaxID=1365924 RepID=A0ABS4TNT2_9PSEU|nr:nuclear transport factor 2 family protein [Kibdelosporangium banguiense]MBP2326061.1 hypothetical protein [Kibdelosporangium banguiense]
MTVALQEYLKRMDGQDPTRALELMEPDLRFLIALPSGEVAGTSKADFEAYIAGRNAVERVHEVIRYSADGDTEMVYGVVTESGEAVGAFLSAAVVSPRGLIARYQSFFSTSFALIDWPEKS